MDAPSPIEQVKGTEGGNGWWYTRPQRAPGTYGRERDGTMDTVKEQRPGQDRSKRTWQQTRYQREMDKEEEKQTPRNPKDPAKNPRTAGAAQVGFTRLSREVVVVVGRKDGGRSWKLRVAMMRTVGGVLEGTDG
jgi:hypothetical protein